MSWHKENVKEFPIRMGNRKKENYMGELEKLDQT